MSIRVAWKKKKEYVLPASSLLILLLPTTNDESQPSDERQRTSVSSKNTNLHLLYSSSRQYPRSSVPAQLEDKQWHRPRAKQKYTWRYEDLGAWKSQGKGVAALQSIQFGDDIGLCSGHSRYTQARWVRHRNATSRGLDDVEGKCGIQRRHSLDTASRQACFSQFAPVALISTSLHLFALTEMHCPSHADGGMNAKCFADRATLSKQRYPSIYAIICCIHNDLWYECLTLWKLFVYTSVFSMICHTTSLWDMMAKSWDTSKSRQTGAQCTTRHLGISVANCSASPRTIKESVGPQCHD